MMFQFTDAKAIKRSLLFWVTVLKIVIALLASGAVIYFLGHR